MTLSTQSWKLIEPVYRNILKHPFIQGLIDGTLAKEKFIFYINQDALYLADYGRALAGIASKLEKPEHIDSFLGFAKDTMSVEKALHQTFLQAAPAREKSPACQLYTSYILGQLATEPAEVCVAAVLPCFWIYKNVGDYILEQKPASDNPYRSWIDTYGGEEYASAVQKAIAIHDELALATPAQQEKMLKAFALCSKMEWMFWDSAYRTEMWPV